MRTLAVTGDDFGATHAVNRAVIEAFDHGVLTSASLLVGGAAATQAIVLARARPGLSVGLHLAVLDGLAVLPPAAVPRLADSDGRLPCNPLAAGLRYQFSRETRRQLAREIRAQLQRFADTGLPLAHVDGHHHMHLHPVVLDILVELAPVFGIPAIRLPAEELGLALTLDRRHRASKILWSGVFRLLRRHGERQLARAGIAYSDRVYGLLATGRVTERYLVGLVPRIRSDNVEIYCHPAAPAPGQPYPGPEASGAEELAALLSERVREAIREQGFALFKPSPERRVGVS